MTTQTRLYGVWARVMTAPGSTTDVSGGIFRWSESKRPPSSAVHSLSASSLLVSSPARVCAFLAASPGVRSAKLLVRRSPLRGPRPEPRRLRRRHLLVAGDEVPGLLLEGDQVRAAISEDQLEPSLTAGGGRVPPAFFEGPGPGPGDHRDPAGTRHVDPHRRGADQAPAIDRDRSAVAVDHLDGSGRSDEPCR